MKSLIISRLFMAALLVSTVACGGGGDDSKASTSAESSQTTTPDTPAPIPTPLPQGVLSGIAATGAPIGGAEVSITGADASVKAVKTNADGLFTLPLQAVKAPALLKVTMSDGRYLMSVWDGSMKGESAVSNITPLTDAVVSAFAKAIGTSGSKLTPYDISKNQKELVQAKQQILTLVEISMRKAGLDPTSFDLMSSPFVANGSGIDAVLDSMTFARSATGETVIYPKQLVLNTVEPGKETAVLVKDPVPISQNEPLTTIVAEDGLLNTAMLNAWRNRINSCMTVEVVKRAGSSACVGIYPTGYKNDGVDFPTNFYAETGENNTVGAVFETPNILSISRDAAGQDVAIVEINWYQPKTRTSHSRLTEFKNLGEAGRLQDNRVSSATGSSWWLLGNQSDYEIRIEPRVTRYENLNKSEESQANAPDSITYGLHVLINEKTKLRGSWVDAGIRAAVVKGPGLPGAGLVLASVDKTRFDSSYLGIMNAAGVLPAVGSYAQTDVNEFRVAADGFDSVTNEKVSKWWSNQTQKLRHSEFSQIPVDFKKFPAQAAYVVTLYFDDARPPLEFLTRLRGALKSLKDVQVIWPEFQQKGDIVKKLTISSPSMSFGWKGSENALRIDSAFMSALAPKLAESCGPQRWGYSKLVEADLRAQTVEFSSGSANACLSGVFPASATDSYVTIGAKALLNGVRYYSMVTWRP